MRTQFKFLLVGTLSALTFVVGTVTPFHVAVANAQGVSDLVSTPPNQLVLLGQQLFNDQTLSNPRGKGCVGCHSSATGFSYPESEDNRDMGPVEGAVKGRFGFRKPPMSAYVTYLPTGLPTYNDYLGAYVGGLFFDGRASDPVAQAQGPFLNPKEMNNANSAAVVLKIRSGPSNTLFRGVYGPNVYNLNPDYVLQLAAQAIAAYEGSSLVSPFTSKYDAYILGKTKLTAQEMRGLQVFTGSSTGRPGGRPFAVNGQCVVCHAIPTSYDPQHPDIFTLSAYVNLGVPKNPHNPIYTASDNPLGANFVDYGLGDFLYPLFGQPSGDLEECDPAGVDGTFRIPCLRNVDKRPGASFVKDYMHDGVMKSLTDVVHFYNTRNLTTHAGEVIDFTKPNPYSNLIGTPLWAQPEWPSADTMINPEGSRAGLMGNLGLSASDEQALVAFLRTLSDGYFRR